MKYLLNKAKPYLLSLLVIASLAVTFIGVSRAADKTVVCNGSGCDSGSGPLFEETNIAPGDSVTRSIKVDNNDNPDACDLTLQTKNDIEEEEPGDFADRLFTVIKDGVVDVFGVRDGSDKATDDKSLADLFAAGPVSLGTIAAGVTNTFDWTVTFGSGAGNKYQSAETEFDFDLVFECGEPEVLALRGVGGPVGAPVCTATAPTSAPVLSAYAGSANTIVLTWTSVSPVTHYTIRYGTSSGSYIYGAPNVGNVTSYVVGALSAGTTYYFQVAGVNDCMPGPWSNEAGATPTGLVLGRGPAPEFEEILGVEDEEGVEEKILGEIACEDEYYPWWLPLVGQVALGAIGLWFIRKKKEEIERWWLIPLLLALVSQIIHEILGCNCATGDWCLRYWLLNLGILALSLLAYRVVTVLPKKE